MSGPTNAGAEREWTVMGYNIRSMTSMFAGNKIKPKDRERAEKIAEVILRVNPHILAINEAATASENQYFIEEFLPASGFKLAHGETRGYENLVMYYRAPLEVESIDDHIDYYCPWIVDIDKDGIDESFTWDKKPLEVVFGWPGGARLRVILVHGPTKGIVQVVDFYRFQLLSAAKRMRALAEAVRLRERLDDLLAEAEPTPFLVLGDMNDDPALDQYEMSLGRGYVDTVTGSIFNPEGVLHNALWWRTSDPKLMADLWTLEYEDPIVREAFGQQQKTWIDHILVTRAMRYGHGSVRLVSESGSIDAKDEISRAASDHYAIYCKLATSEPDGMPGE